MFEEFDKTKVKTGFKEVLKLISEKKAVKVYIAEDCDESFKEKALAAAQRAGIPAEYAPSMKELGKACKIDVGASCAALMD